MPNKKVAHCILAVTYLSSLYSNVSNLCANRT